MELDVEVEIMATEVDPADVGSDCVRLVDARHAKVDLIGTTDEIVAALQRIADILGECGYDVAARDPGPAATKMDVPEFHAYLMSSPIKDLPEVMERIREYNEGLGAK